MSHGVTPVEFERDVELERARHELEHSKRQARGAFEELRALLKRMSDEILHHDRDDADAPAHGDDDDVPGAGDGHRADAGGGALAQTLPRDHGDAGGVEGVLVGNADAHPASDADLPDVRHAGAGRVLRKEGMT